MSVAVSRWVPAIQVAGGGGEGPAELIPSGSKESQPGAQACGEQILSYRAPAGAWKQPLPHSSWTRAHLAESRRPGDLRNCQADWESQDRVLLIFSIPGTEKLWATVPHAGAFLSKLSRLPPTLAPAHRDAFVPLQSLSIDSFHESCWFYS